MCRDAVGRLFCDLHGNELVYHKPKGAVTGETAGYDATPAGSIDMSKVAMTFVVVVFFGGGG